MEFSFVCSSNEKTIYENNIGKETSICINGLQSKGIIKSVDSNKVIVETDEEISEILKSKIGLK